MVKRKNYLMYQLFGFGIGSCKDCKHFVSYRHHDKNYRKCSIYGITASEASDWVGKYQACGMLNQDTKHENVIRLVKGSHKTNEIQQVDGQLSLFEQISGSGTGKIWILKSI